jgi:regulator of protease activity HflC (stomatin/prohibitin superfamily)
VTPVETVKMDRRLSLGRLGAAAVILALLLAIFSLVVVESGQVGVVIRTGSDASPRMLVEPGIYARLPFAERVWLVDTRLQTTEQGVPLSYITQDKQTLQLSGWAAWRVSDAVRFNTSTASGKNPVNERVLAALGKTLTPIVQSKTLAALQSTLTTDEQTRWLMALNNELETLGITAEQIGIRQIALSEAANETIYNRMAASRQQAEQRLVQGLSADEQQLVALQTKQRDQVLGEAYQQSQQQRQAAESKLLAAYAKQYGQAAAFQQRLKPTVPAPAAVAAPAASPAANPVGAVPARSE